MHRRSPTPSLRPFDRRFQSRLSVSPSSSPRGPSPSFLTSHSRHSSHAFSLNGIGEPEPTSAPWDVVRWTRLRKIAGQAFSEVGKRNFGRPTCISVSAVIALGTSKGILLLFDYSQNLKSIIGQGTDALKAGSVTSISVSADLSTIAGGHASGDIFTWEIARSAKPFLHIPSINRQRSTDVDGHAPQAAILHLGFLGARHTALVSADDKGMAFSHLATRGMGMITRTVKTTRILGRYPENTPSEVRQRKPSSVLGFSPLPLGNAEHAADSMGLVAMLTPYLLVIVSTTPIAQTQYKTSRPKEVAAHSAMSGALAWFPSVKLKGQSAKEQSISKPKLVYCWSNVLTVLEVVDVEPSATSDNGPPALQYRPRSRWQCDEAIVAVQWLGRSVLAILTISQQLVILDDVSLRKTDSSDLIQTHLYHKDLFSQQLASLIERLDEEDTSMHGVVADAFYMSFRAYKGRLFLLGFNEVTFGTLSNWADRLLALMEKGDHIGAIELATSYYSGDGEKVTVGLMDDDPARHKIVGEKLLEMITASLRFTFGSDDTQRSDQDLIEGLANACIIASITMKDLDFLYDEVYPWFEQNGSQSIFLESLETYVLDDEITLLSPPAVKDLVEHFTVKGLQSRLEEMICHLDPRTMDIDQITGLCKRNHLFDALLYVWSQALGDYTSILDDLLNLTMQMNGVSAEHSDEGHEIGTLKIFPYLSFIFTGRIYPTGKEMDDDQAFLAKAELYHFFFSGGPNGWSKHDPSAGQSNGQPSTYRNLRRVLDFDAPSFLSVLNEAFEDPFLNGQHSQVDDGRGNRLTEEQTFGSSVNRPWIVTILLEVLSPDCYDNEDTIYLDMFIARNLPKFPQYILLPGHILHRVVTRLCNFPSGDIADDCQLSVEYLLSIYKPPDLASLIPLFKSARFFRVLKSVYNANKQYARLLQTCLEDKEDPDAVFKCIADCLKPTADLSTKQAHEVRTVIEDNAQALALTDPTRAAAVVDRYANDLHDILLQAMAEDEIAQLRYLRAILEPDVDQMVPPRTAKRAFIEQYVRLLCDYEPQHVSEYVEHLKSGDLRLEKVLRSLESSGAVDAAIVLMAREGKVRHALDRLSEQLKTLEAALLGLLEGARDSPDTSNTAETAEDLVASIQKYVRVGTWLCRGQTRSAQQRRTNGKTVKRPPGADPGVVNEEQLWVDLVDSVVSLTRNVTEALHISADEPLKPTENMTKGHPSSIGIDAANIANELRLIVQETFTALLTLSSAPPDKDDRQGNLSFLRVFKAFLSRASQASSSLSQLRSVLGAIFSAYTYEESLLSLSNQLLNKDLFVHVAEAETLRRRGWRPLGQVCEACGKKAWGPGVGAHVWQAWQADMQSSARLGGDDDNPTQKSREPVGRGKGKALADITAQQRTVSSNQPGDTGSDADAMSPLVIFSCRHMFHRRCLEKMKSTNGEIPSPGIGNRSPGLIFQCPLEAGK